MLKTKYSPTSCPCCKQTKDYALPLDRGTALIVLAIYNRVRDKGENRVHILKEMVRDPKDFAGDYKAMVSGGWLTVRMEGNISRPRHHGLIAMHEERGEYLITSKGARFLRGEPVKAVKIVDKTDGHHDYYLEGEVTFKELMGRETPFWNLDRADLDRIVGDSFIEQPALI